MNITNNPEQDRDQHDNGNGKIGPSQQFVISRGFRDGILIGVDGTARLFLELTADIDRTEVRPMAAWRDLISSLPPGWTVRVLQAVWPDPAPRAAFRRTVEEEWTRPAHEGQQLLYDTFHHFLEEVSLPFLRRTIVELAVPTGALEDAFSFVDGTIAMLAGYGVRAEVLDESAIRTLTRGIFNPEVHL